MISTKDWINYIDKMSALSEEAAQKMKEYIWKNSFRDREAVIRYAYALATKYGEGSAELAAQMYDAVAEMSSTWTPRLIEEAEPAETASFEETAKAINGSLKQSPSGQLLDQAVARLVKQAAADTTLKNAVRDGAEFAWIPYSDTCAFCLTLASRGWQKASKKALKNGHAEHIHAHCDCQYAIRFDGKSGVKGYDPDKYADMYYSAEGRTPQEKINAMRRLNYKQYAEKIREQKREAYAIRTGKEEV